MISLSCILARFNIKTPAFWYQDPGIISGLLSPVAYLYSTAGRLRQALSRTVKLSRPVICVGNLVAGGAGKTPVTLAIAQTLCNRNYQPHIISRGYGAQVNTPIHVDTRLHTFDIVGDEPLLLANAAPTWVCKDRNAACEQAIQAGASHLIFDDGFQNPTIQKDLSLLVVDGLQGFGNFNVLPAGPLREFPEEGIKRADAVILIGQDLHHIQEFADRHKRPFLQAEIKPIDMRPRRVVSFAGLGFPVKFFNTLEQHGYQVVEQISFPDHHPYRVDEIEKLIERAETLQADLITTAKDMLRIAPQYHKHIDMLKIKLQFRNEALLEQLLGRVYS